jgi:hypothetical protein
MSSVWAPSIAWLSAIRRYLAVIALGNLVWEFAHMPLYTLWQIGTAGEIFFAVIHCTGGDVIIATVSLVLAILISGRSAWPRGRFLRVAATTVILGLSYTVFSEWLNVEIRRSWAYSDLMPTVPWLGVGLTPLAQWLVIPGLGFWQVRRCVLRPDNSAELRA